MSRRRVPLRTAGAWRPRRGLGGQRGSEGVSVCDGAAHQHRGRRQKKKSAVSGWFQASPGCGGRGRVEELGAEA